MIGMGAAMVMSSSLGPCPSVPLAGREGKSEN
jgi:hypothetical protein